MTDREIRYVHHREQPVDIMPVEAVDAIKEATAEVLWRTGIEVRSEHIFLKQRARRRRRDRGSSRAGRGFRTTCSAARSQPSRPTCRSGPESQGSDLVLDGSRGCLVGVDGNAAEVVDLDTDERRASRKEDVATGTLIGDALPQIGYIWQPAVSRERSRCFPAAARDNLEANLNNTGKHIVTTTAVTPEQAASGGAPRSAAVARRRRQALRDQAILSAFQCAGVSPLVYDGGPLAAAVEFAKADVPSGFMVMPILGATAPITVAPARWW